MVQSPDPGTAGAGMWRTSESSGHPASAKTSTVQLKSSYVREKSVVALSARLVQGAPVVPINLMVKRSDPLPQVPVPARVRKRSMPGGAAKVGVAICRMAVETKGSRDRSFIVS